jgi:hypothetical protein
LASFGRANGAGLEKLASFRRANGFAPAGIGGLERRAARRFDRVSPWWAGGGGRFGADHGRLGRGRFGIGGARKLDVLS